MSKDTFGDPDVSLYLLVYINVCILDVWKAVSVDRRFSGLLLQRTCNPGLAGG